MRNRRWSDNDHYFGPFTFSKNDSYHPKGIILDSGGGEDEDTGCELLIHLHWATVIIGLPPLIKPRKRKVKFTHLSDEALERLGQDWYYEYKRKRYGFNLSGNFLQVFYGSSHSDMSNDQQWSCFLPWTEWRHIRHDMYDTHGNLFWSESQAKGGLAGVRDWIDAREMCPSMSFEFEDFDGEKLTARTYIDEREWKAGTGWFKWLSLFRKNKIHRSLEIEFSGETGDRKGSWKGGTVGHSIEMLPAEWHEGAFKRYCDEHNMTFIRRIE